MQSRSHALIQGSRIPQLSPSLAGGCASYKQPRRCYATRLPAPKKIAVLGGGITGLSTAYYLSKSLPNATITLYEAKKQLGGWLQTKRKEVPGGTAWVNFEQGPRTLRKSIWGLFTLEMIVDLGLRDDIIFVHKNSPAAQNRYIYDKDHILRLPNSVRTGIEACLSGEKTILRAIKEALFEWQKPKRDIDMADESIADFLARRGLKQTSEDLASAFVHGVYAGTIDELSARSTPPFDRLWMQESLYGSITRSIFSKTKGTLVMPARLQRLFRHLPIGYLKQDHEVRELYRICSVFGLRGGLGSLVNALEKKLIQNRVNIIREGVTKLEQEPSGNGITVHTPRKTSNLLKTHDLVISALPAKTTSRIALDGMAIKSGSASFALNRQAIREALPVPTVTVMVVNLFYKQRGLVPQQGFGYLIPQSLVENPERALGVIFDSDVISESVGGTKLTVMLGGHMWDGWPQEWLPSEEEAVQGAKSLLARHLKIDAEPSITNVALQKECIPQYKVGHDRKMLLAHQALQQTYKGRVRVVGNSYSGVGVHDCVVAAKLMAVKIQEEVAEGGMYNTRTGLEHYGSDGGERGWLTGPVYDSWRDFL